MNPDDIDEVEVYKQRGSFAVEIDIKAKDLKKVKSALDTILTDYKVPSQVLMVVELEAV